MRLAQVSMCVRTQAQCASVLKHHTIVKCLIKEFPIITSMCKSGQKLHNVTALNHQSLSQVTNHVMEKWCYVWFNIFISKRSI